MKKKLVRITTVPGSLGGLLEGQLKFMSEYFEVIGISAAGKGTLSLQDVGEQENIKVIPVSMSRKIELIKDFKAVIRLCRVFAKERPHIVHTHTPKAGLLGMLAAFMTRVPNRLHTVAGMPLLEAKGKKRKLLDLMEKLTYFCATKVYPNSFGLKDIIIQNKYTSSKKVKVIGNGSSNGIDTKHFDPSLYTIQDKEGLGKSIGVDKNDFVFLFVGRLVKDKGINELISAFDKLNTGSNNIKLLLVGKLESELDPLHADTIFKIESEKKIISVGWQNDVRPYFALSDCLVFPSYREGFPNAVLQASAMGLPSIVSNINGCNEIIQNGENGIIVPPKSIDKLYDAMNLISNNREVVSLDSKGIRKRIEDKYRRQVIWDKILKEYEALIID